VFRARDPLLVLGQLLAAGVGTLAALAATGWPGGLTGGLVGLAGAFIGLLIALGVEHVVRLHREVRRLQHIERESQAGQEQRAEERRLWSYQLALARRESAMNEVYFKVYADAHLEAEKTGQVVPGVAMIARTQVHMQAKGFDKPLPPLEEWKAPPPGQAL
jgi:hypothetical protein